MGVGDSRNAVIGGDKEVGYDAGRIPRLKIPEHEFGRPPSVLRTPCHLGGCSAVRGLRHHDRILLCHALLGKSGRTRFDWLRRCSAGRSCATRVQRGSQEAMRFQNRHVLSELRWGSRWTCPLSGINKRLGALYRFRGFSRLIARYLESVSI